MREDKMKSNLGKTAERLTFFTASFATGARLYRMFYSPIKQVPRFRPEETSYPSDTPSQPTAKKNSFK